MTLNGHNNFLKIWFINFFLRTPLWVPQEIDRARVRGGHVPLLWAQWWTHCPKGQTPGTLWLCAEQVWKNSINQIKCNA